MALKKSEGRSIDLGGALLTTCLIALAAWALGGFYYDLNDDVLIKDILSGVYTGRPEGHTMQILYPLGLLLSLFYHIPKVPVFGLFLCLCQFTSIFVITYRLTGCLSSGRQKAMAFVSQLLFWLGACLEHLVFVQYTVTAGMLGAAAIFWMATSGKEKALKGFLKENLGALILYWLCFCLRSEMGLLLLPLAGVTGFCKWFSGGHPLKKENWIRYMGLFGTLMAGIILCFAADRFAYRSQGWQEFGRFFDARTTVYDYQRDVVEDYDDNREIYEALDMSRTRQALLKNYNFGADDFIDAALMEELAAAAQSRENGGLFRKDLRTALWELVRGHFLSSSDFCLNAAMLFLGLVLFALGFFMEKKHSFWEVPLIAVCGCALWMFLLLRDRMPTRISTPLYLAMTASFGGLLLGQTAKCSAKVRAFGNERSERAQGASGLNGRAFESVPGKLAARRLRYEWNGWVYGHAVLAAGLGLVLVGVLTIPQKTASVIQQVSERKTINSVNEAVMEYCAQSPELLYLEDVYSTVSFSEKIGVDREKPFNYDLLGGWLVKSPLTDEKLAAFGLESMGDAVRCQEQVRLLTESGSGLAWLTDFLAEQGIEAEAVLVDTVAEGAVEVYRIVER